MLENINGKIFKEMIITGAKKLQANKELINNLNVFPVPDGDTGTNMALTLASALEQLEKIKLDTLKQVADALSNGTLMGARGNSGVILAQLFRGLAKGAGQRESLNAVGLAKALDLAVKTAYQSGGLKPVEGTILTVAREAARAAKEKARRSKDVLAVWKVTVETAEKTLAQTPKMLKILNDAGVVDAGGQGLVFILQGALEYLLGKNSLDQIHEPKLNNYGLQNLDNNPSCGLEYKYCTEFIIKGEMISLKDLESYLEFKGDCLLVVGSPKLVKVHLHTNHPGIVLEYALQWGDLSNIQISNMVEQYQNKVKQESSKLRETVEKEIGLVAVAPGQGIARLFSNLGCDEVIEGGQTMNPSTEDLLARVERVKAKRIILLPNNKNITLAAQQLSELVNDKDIMVIPSTSIPQGMAALLAFSPGLEREILEKRMGDAIKSVKTGEVTYAVRNYSYQGGEIKTGDILGIWEGEITTVGDSSFHVIQNLLAQKINQEEEIITLFYGKDVTQQEAVVLAEELAKNYPHLEVELQEGGQPHYYYIISVE